jgi:hypothetical protein
MRALTPLILSYYGVTVHDARYLPSSSHPSTHLPAPVSPAILFDGARSKTDPVAWPTEERRSVLDERLDCQLKVSGAYRRRRGAWTLPRLRAALTEPPLTRASNAPTMPYRWRKKQ